MSIRHRNIACMLVLLAGIGVAGCKKKSNVAGPASGCDPACAAGQVCADSRCRALCEIEAHCDTGQVCTDEGICVTPSTGTAPEITAVDGTGSPNGAAAHHLRDRIVVTGTGLEGALGALRAKAGTAWESLEAVDTGSNSAIAF